MMRAMYSAVSGMKNHQIMLDVVGNDLANVNTIGYKADRVTFKDALYQMQAGATGGTATVGGKNAEQIGLGVQLGSIDHQMQTGAMQTTGNPLDVAIAGTGYFRVANTVTAGAPVGLQYTRAGNFTLDNNGNLVTSSGQFVVGYAVDATTGAQTTTPPTQAIINIPVGSTNVSVGQDGMVSYDTPGGVRNYAGQITLAKFPNEQGLSRAGGSDWTTSSNSGAEQVGTPGDANFTTTSLVAGAVEMSNVDMATEFTTMITAQRGFQASGRMITTADQLLETLVNLGR
ncbi:MAG TPA: flagellar hook-basal body complex protein [Solirubrobacteraceae bacterium]|jgi:flagellar hook protein FlgE|nr:flagellar hook-basal body complex protein [Solirubrobacteraceae bacterium]